MKASPIARESSTSKDLLGTCRVGTALGFTGRRPFLLQGQSCRITPRGISASAQRARTPAIARRHHLKDTFDLGFEVSVGDKRSFQRRGAAYLRYISLD